MTEQPPPPAIVAARAPLRTKPGSYPEPFASRMGQRSKRPLGDLFGLRAFGVNLTRLAPGAQSALHHVHSRQDEFVYVLEGELTLFTDAGSTILHAGMAAGFAAGGTAHHLENRSAADAVFLEIGDRAPDDTVRYPDDDLLAVRGEDGAWRAAHKNGEPY